MQTLPIALKRAAEEDVEFRRGLPRDYLGIENRRNHAEKRGFLQTALGLVKRLEHYVSLSLGAGVDQMGAQFMHDALPPVFTPGSNNQIIKAEQLYWMLPLLEPVSLAKTLYYGNGQA